MSDWMTPADLATGCPADLDLDSSGLPRRPLVLIDLHGPIHPDSLPAAVEAARRSLPLLIGVADASLPSSARPLVEALTLTLAADEGLEALSIPVSDLPREVERLSVLVGENPRAAVLLGHLLRQSEQLSVPVGLTAEAATYSLLLGGAELHRWLEQRGPAAAALPVKEPVAVARAGDVFRITLQRPERRNAVDSSLRDALVEALAVALADPALRVQLDGAGPDFCSGGDLDEFGTAADYVAAYLVRLQRHPGRMLYELRHRARVLVHGACIGAGIEMAAFAGEIVATPSSYFMLPEVGMGLVPGAGGTISIPRRIGRWRTAWMALTGSRINAETALDWGLVDEVRDMAWSRS